MAGLLALVVAVCVAASSCAGPDAPAREARVFQGATMGTTFTVKVLVGDREPAELDHLEPLIVERLEEVNAKMSTYRAESELSRFNGHRSLESFSVSAETFDVFRLSREISVASRGAFDVTVGPLVNRWGFGPDERMVPPTAEELEKLRARIGYELVELVESESALRKTSAEVEADLSAIAKGYGVDRVAEALEIEGVESFMVEVGGEIRTKGVNDQGMAWQLAIEIPDPDRRAIHRVVPVSGASLATSGDYRNFYLVDGERISHTIDPRSLGPVRHAQVSASVIHESCAVADAWATALMVLGPEEGLELAEELELAALLLVSSPAGIEERMSSAFRERIESGE